MTTWRDGAGRGGRGGAGDRRDGTGRPGRMMRCGDSDMAWRGVAWRGVAWRCTSLTRPKKNVTDDCEIYAMVWSVLYGVVWCGAGGLRLATSPLLLSSHPTTTWLSGPVLS